MGQQAVGEENANGGHIAGKSPPPPPSSSKPPDFDDEEDDESAVGEQLIEKPRSPTSPSPNSAPSQPDDGGNKAAATSPQFDEFDDLMDHLCGPGRFTWLLLFVGFLCNICPGAVSLGHALFLYTPGFVCDVNATLADAATAPAGGGCLATAVSATDEQCSLLLNCTNSSAQRLPCSAWIFDPAAALSVTMTTRFQLVCDRAPLSRLPATLYFVGFLVGSTAYGVLSDRIGRLKAMAAANVQLGLFAMAAAAAPTFPLLLLAEALAGAGTAGSITVTCAFLVELTPRRLRSQLLFNGSHGWCLGILLITLAAWLMPDYRHQLAAASCLSLIGAACVPAIGESPRWLLSAGRVKAAAKAVVRIAAWNRRRLPPNAAELQVAAAASAGRSGAAGLPDLLRTPGLRRLTLLTWALFFSISMCYYGVGLGIGSLGGSVLLGCVFLALVEPPSRFLGGLLCSRFGRRQVLATCFACIGVSIIACSVMFRRPSLSAWRTACAIFGSFWSCLAFTTVWLYANEAFPTPVRAAGAGSGSTQARLGALLSTLVAMLEAYWPPAPFAVFGCVAMATLAVVYLLPETFGCSLPATLADGERFGRQIGSVPDKPEDSEAAAAAAAV